MKNKNVEAVKPVYTNKFTYNYRDEEFEVNYRESLPFNEYAKLVTSVVNQVINNETGYNPFVYEIALAQNLISFYTDCKIPDDIDEFYSFISCTGIVRILSSKLPIHQFVDEVVYDSEVERIGEVINSMIEFKRLQLANYSKFDELCSTLTDILVKLDKKYGKAINPKQINNIIEKLDSMKMTEQGFINAIIDKIPKENKPDIKIVGTDEAKNTEEQI